MGPRQVLLVNKLEKGSVTKVTTYKRVELWVEYSENGQFGDFDELNFWGVPEKLRGWKKLFSGRSVSKSDNFLQFANSRFDLRFVFSTFWRFEWPPNVMCLKSFQSLFWLTKCDFLFHSSECCAAILPVTLTKQREDLLSRCHPHPQAPEPWV